MKKTLLELVQAILNDMDADEVDAITDTFESEQVAVIVRDSYFSLIDSRNWAHLKQFVALTETDANTPTSVTVPDTMKELILLKYDVRKSGETRTKYKTLTFLHPDEFLDKQNELNNDETNVDEVTIGAAAVKIRNDVRPTYWTSFDDETIVMDAYDSDVETFLASNKFQCLAYVTPTWTHDDAFTPDLPEKAFTLLLEEAKSTAFYTLKNMTNEKAESRAQRADSFLARKDFVTQGGVRYPDYGRRPSNHVNRKPHPLEKND